MLGVSSGGLLFEYLSCSDWGNCFTPTYTVPVKSFTISLSINTVQLSKSTSRNSVYPEKKIAEKLFLPIKYLVVFSTHPVQGMTIGQH